MSDPTAPGYRTAVVGATGAAGSTVLAILAERGFPISELRLLASARSAGQSVDFGGSPYVVKEVDEAALRNVDVAFFAAGSAVARQFAPIVAQGGGVAVDKSSAYRADPGVPLVVPHVNAAAIDGHHGIVANPNCVAIPLTMVLAPLQRAAGLRQVTLATYQAASGGGRNLADELERQRRDDAAGTDPVAKVYPHVLHGNVVPGGWSMHGDDTDEEVKVVAETRRVLSTPELPISVTTVRVPVVVGHSAAVWIECEQPLSPDAARQLLAAASGVRVVDDAAQQSYPTPLDAAGHDDVLVGRIRRDMGNPDRICLFFSSDNLRRGAATNAVEVAEIAMQRRPVRAV